MLYCWRVQSVTTTEPAFFWFFNVFRKNGVFFLILFIIQSVKFYILYLELIEVLKIILYNKLNYNIYPWNKGKRGAKANKFGIESTLVCLRICAKPFFLDLTSWKGNKAFLIEYLFFWVLSALTPLGLTGTIATPHVFLTWTVLSLLCAFDFNS